MNIFTGKKVLVLGGGISGTGVARVLAQNGAEVLLSDKAVTGAIKKAADELGTLGVKILTGEQSEALLEGIECVVLSPGIPLVSSLPAKAVARGIEVISEVEVAYLLTQIPVIAITGTNGKTTTTTLAGKLLSESGFNTVVGGNIGAALSLEIADNVNADVVVAEISSYQMEASHDFHPVIAAMLNITPDHLERHGSMEEYFRTKSRIFARQSAGDYLVLNHDDKWLRNIKQTDVQAKIVWFSRRTELGRGVFVSNGQIVINTDGKKIALMPVADLKLPGGHNVENVLAAVACAYLFGANLTAMQRVLSEFAGVEHRIEFVRDVGGVAYYNDSKSTNPESTIPALTAFERRIILLAGGRDKNTPLNAMMQLAKEKSVKMIFFGEAAERFQQAAITAGIDYIQMTDDLPSALETARAEAESGDIVLLSPACASFDQYANFEQRGEHFKKLVAEMG